MPKVAILHPGIHGVYGDPENDALTTSFLADVTVVRYTAGMTKEELLAAIPSGLTHVSFVYHNPGNSSLPFFPDVPGASGVSGEKPKYQYFSDTAIEILRSVSSNGLTVDILACDLKEAAYVEEVQKIETDLGINIRYSAGKIGNPSSGGSWTLESNEIAVNVRDIYFTDDVLAWNSVLSGDIAEDIKLGIYSNDISWNGINTFKVLRNFSWTGIGLDATDFIELSGNEIFDGSGYEIDISGLSWEGLITISPSVINIGTAPLIKNLGVINGDIGGPLDNGGAIVRAAQKFFSIRSCWSTGDISGNAAGGIAGGYSGQIGGECDISGCHSTGTIYGNTAGGIVGPNAGESGGLCTISECYHIGGDISGDNAGGIAGASAGGTGSAGTCIITDCYSTALIVGQNAGGIAGTYAGSFDGTCNISCCYSQGEVGGANAGGIAGSLAGDTAGSGGCTISKCYSIGNIGGGGAGGIAGTYAGKNVGKCIISDCYSTGDIGGGNAGGIVGSNAGPALGICDISNCYSAGVISGGTAGGIAGANASATTCTITNCVCNGTPIDGSNIITDPTGSTDLADISLNIYTGWSPLVWQPGGPVAPTDYNLPILNCFKVNPWISDLYNAANDPAGFELPTPTLLNSFALRVNPFVALSPVLVYTQEAMDALVTGEAPPLNPRVSWAEFGMPAGSLLRDLGRAVVVKVSPTNPLHAYRFQKIQLIRGPTSEGVGGSPIDAWLTGYICVWAAGGVPPVFP